MRRFRVCLLALLFVVSGVGCVDETDGDDTGVDDTSIEKDTGPPDDTTDIEPDTQPPIDTDDGRDADTTPSPDTDTGTDETPDGGADVDSGPDCTVDTDRDGLSDCDERQLCTDPTDGDTDDDNLGDFEEIQRTQTDPCSADTDGDGASDGKENRLGTDPKKPPTGPEKWILTACDNIKPETVKYHDSRQGNWTIALPVAFNNYTNLNVTGYNTPRAAAVYDDPNTEVSGFTLSETAPAGQTTPVTTLSNRVATAVRSQVDNVLFSFPGPEFTTHDGKVAATLDLEVRVSTKQSVRRLRDRLLTAIGPSRSDIKGLPTSAGVPYEKFRVEISAIHRKHKGGDETNLYSVAIAPLSKFSSNGRVQFRVDDLTNTTNVADVADIPRRGCERMKPSKEVPKAEFYWVLDNSGSMNQESALVKSFAKQFIGRIKNTRLDYRLGVTNTSIGNQGSLAVPPSWHTGAAAFRNQIDQAAINCGGPFQCSGATEKGLRASYLGLRHMLGLTSTPPSSAEKIRSDAQVITIWMTDEGAQGNNLGKAQKFFKNNQRVTGFALTPQTSRQTPTFDCSEGPTPFSGEYKKAARNSGGVNADLCSKKLTQVLSTIIRKATQNVTSFEFSGTPISSTLRVYLNGQWVPRSTEDGFNYSPKRNVLTFYGKYRPSYNRGSSKPPDWVAVTYEEYYPRCKERGNYNTCSKRNP